MSDRFFTVKSDRFSLVSDREYIIRGYLARGAHLLAEADGEPVPSESEAVYHFNDERYGGIEVRCAVTLPEGGVRKKLVLYAERQGERQNVFSVPARVLKEKQTSLQIYLDDTAVMKSRGAVYITGWAAAASKVGVRVVSPSAAVNAQITRALRPDVKDMYDECEVDEECGFNIRISPVPKGSVVLEFAAGENAVRETIATGTITRQFEKTGKLLRKGIRHLRYHGIASFTAKVQEKLNGPKVKPVFYPDWIREHLPDEEELARERREEMPDGPQYTVIPLPRRNGTDPSGKARFAQSLKEQSYEAWSSEEPEHFCGTLHLDGTQDAFPDADGGKAGPRWVVFASEDGFLSKNALYEIAKRIAEQPDLRMIYADSDAADEKGSLSDPDMKPDFSPDYLAAANYIGYFAAVREDVLSAVDALTVPRTAEDLYGFYFAVTEETEAVGHIPKVLYHTALQMIPKERGDDEAAQEEERAAAAAHYKRMGLPADVVMGEVPFTYRTVWHWEEKPMVSVLIPNKDHIDDLRICIQSLTEKCTWPNMEILIIENNSEDPRTFEGYEALQMLDARIRTVTYEGGFNYSKINNFGASCAKGEYLFLLNNDTEALSDVVTELMGYCMRPDVGIVGARLYYGDNTIQHAGVILGWGGVAGHAFVNQKRGAERLLNRIAVQQNYSAVTAACMMVDRNAFDAAGGLSEDLAVAFNDIDFCLKVGKAGYRVVYNPYAEMYHYESKSRGLEDSPEKKARFQGEIALFRQKWGDVLEKGDPFYSPNLSMITQDFSLKE